MQHRNSKSNQNYKLGDNVLIDFLMGGLGFILFVVIWIGIIGILIAFYNGIFGANGSIYNLFWILLWIAIFWTAIWVYLNIDDL